jgi:hypothetical protein
MRFFLQNNRPKYSPTHFLKKIIIQSLNRAKEGAQTMWLLLLFSKKLPKENNYPKGQNSPKLVTVTYVTKIVAKKKFVDQ